MQYERSTTVVERAAARGPARRRCRRRSTTADASAPAGDRTVSGPSPSERRQHGGLHPARAPHGGGRRRSGTSTSSTSQAGRRRTGSRSAMPGVRATRTTPEPSAPDPGRERRALGPEPHGVLAGEQHADRPPVLDRPGGGRRPPTSDGDLAAERAAVGQRRRRLAARHAPRRVGLEVAGLDPRRAQRAVPSPAGSSNGQVQRGGRPPSLHLAGRGAGLGQRLADHPVPAGRPHRDEGVGRRGVVGEAAAPERHLGAPTCCAVRPSMAARRAAAAEVARPAACGAASPPATARAASRIVCQPVQRQRWASRAWSIAAGVSGPRRAAADSRTTIPGVQNPHWLAPAAVNAAAQRSASSRPSTVVTSRSGHPPGRGHAGHPGLAVHQHRAAAALPLRAAAVLGRAHAGAGPAGPRATSSRRRAPRPPVRRGRSGAGAATPTTLRRHRPPGRPPTAIRGASAVGRRYAVPSRCRRACPRRDVPARLDAPR